MLQQTEGFRCQVSGVRTCHFVFPYEVKSEPQKVEIRGRFAISFFTENEFVGTKSLPQAELTLRNSIFDIRYLPFPNFTCDFAGRPRPRAMLTPET